MATPDRQPTKAEQRRLARETREAAELSKKTIKTRNRRLLITGLAASTVVTLVGGGLYLNQSPSIGNSEPEIPRYLKDLDKRIPSTPSLLADHALTIAGLTMTEFCKQTGASPVELPKAISFAATNSDYARMYDQIYDCTDTASALQAQNIAATGIEKNKVIVNFEQILKDPELSKAPASLLAELTSHEWGHFFAILREAVVNERIPLTTNISKSGSKKKGLAFLEPRENLSKPGAICRFMANGASVVDESTIQFQAQRVIRGMGYDSYKTIGYQNYMPAYQEAVVAYVRDQFPSLFTHHQATDTDGFFNFLGQKIQQTDQSKLGLNARMVAEQKINDVYLKALK